ncbi:MAG: cysteine dioxygenase family protein [Phycisphaeraceae bacterium]|nr:cysteine dioxygenase family protein [Phycisphaeraceae bacterium]
MSSRLVIPDAFPLGEPLAAVFVEAAGAERPEGVARALSGDLASMLPDRVPTDDARYCRTELWRDDRAVALLIAWLPGQFSDIHDHDGVECVFRVVRGVAVERRYALDTEGLARLESEDRFLPGSVIASLGDDIHSLGNDASSGETLVTLHVYRPDARMRVHRAAEGEGA